MLLLGSDLSPLVGCEDLGLLTAPSICLAHFLMRTQDTRTPAHWDQGGNWTQTSTMPRPLLSACTRFAKICVSAKRQSGPVDTSPVIPPLKVL